MYECVCVYMCVSECECLGVMVCEIGTGTLQFSCECHMILNVGLKQFHYLAIFFRLQLCHGRGIHAFPLEHQNEARA